MECVKRTVPNDTLFLDYDFHCHVLACCFVVGAGGGGYFDFSLVGAFFGVFLDCDLAGLGVDFEFGGAAEFLIFHFAALFLDGEHGNCESFRGYGNGGSLCRRP